MQLAWDPFPKNDISALESGSNAKQHGSVHRITEDMRVLRIYNRIQYSLFNESDVINPKRYLTYGLHDGTKYMHKTMPNQQYTTYYKRN